MGGVNEWDGVEFERRCANEEFALGEHGNIDGKFLNFRSSYEF